VILTNPIPGRINPRSTIYGEIWRTPSRAAVELGRRRCIATTSAPNRLWPPDPRSTHEIRSRVPLRPEPPDQKPTPEIRSRLRWGRERQIKIRRPRSTDTGSRLTLDLSRLFQIQRTRLALDPDRVLAIRSRSSGPD
jgi:hypothetical protein